MSGCGVYFHTILLCLCVEQQTVLTSKTSAVSGDVTLSAFGIKNPLAWGLKPSDQLLCVFLYNFPLVVCSNFPAFTDKVVKAGRTDDRPLSAAKDRVVWHYVNTKSLTKDVGCTKSVDTPGRRLHHFY